MELGMVMGLKHITCFASLSIKMNIGYHQISYTGKWKILIFKFKQECIPVGRVLPARYRTGGLPNRDALDRDPHGHVTCGACWDTDPPCEQNHRRLWKHNLSASSLPAVIMSLLGSTIVESHGTLSIPYKYLSHASCYLMRPVRLLTRPNSDFVSGDLELQDVLRHGGRSWQSDGLVLATMQVSLTCHMLDVSSSAQMRRSGPVFRALCKASFTPAVPSLRSRAFTICWSKNYDLIGLLHNFIRYFILNKMTL